MSDETGRNAAPPSDDAAAAGGSASAPSTDSAANSTAEPEKRDPTAHVAVVPDADAAPAGQQNRQNRPAQRAGGQRPFLLGFNGAQAFRGGGGAVELSESELTYTQCITCVQIVMLCGQLFAYAWALHTYVQHKDDSPGCDKPLTTWLLVNGIYGIILVAFTGLLMCVVIDMMLNRGEPSDMTVSCLPCIGIGTCCIVLPISMFHLAWIIVGSVWTYGMDRNGCSDDVYVFCYWYITFTWVSAGISCLLGRRENPYMQRIRNQA